jgi:hypothetical protein
MDANPSRWNVHIESIADDFDVARDPANANRVSTQLVLRTDARDSERLRNGRKVLRFSLFTGRGLDGSVSRRLQHRK